MHAKLLQLGPTLCNSIEYIHQTSLSMGFSRQEYWGGLPFRPPEELPDPGIEPGSLTSPSLAGGSFTIIATREAILSLIINSMVYLSILILLAISIFMFEVCFFVGSIQLGLVFLTQFDNFILLVGVFRQSAFNVDHDTVENTDVTRQARFPPHTAYGLEWRGNRNELHHHPAHMQLTTVIVKTLWETQSGQRET